MDNLGGGGSGSGGGGAPAVVPPPALGAFGGAADSEGYHGCDVLGAGGGGLHHETRVQAEHQLGKSFSVSHLLELQAYYYQLNNNLIAKFDY